MGSEKLGTSCDTICSAGSAMSSCAMGLAGTGHNFNPSTLNKCLITNGGYFDGDGLIWGWISKLGLPFEGKVSNSLIKSKLDAGKVVVCNVHNGGHWVLAHAYSGDNIMVNDPGYSTTSYAISQIVDGQNAIYGAHAGGLYNLMGKLKNLRSLNYDLMTMADRGRLEKIW